MLLGMLMRESGCWGCGWEHGARVWVGCDVAGDVDGSDAVRCGKVVGVVVLNCGGGCAA